MAGSVRTRVRELTKSGVLTKGPGGYAVRASVKAYLAFLRSTPGNLTDERARLTRALAGMAELKLPQRSGELVLKAAVKAEFFALARAVRDHFQNWLAVPRAWSPANAISNAAMTFGRRGATNPGRVNVSRTRQSKSRSLCRPIH